jgi:hypothetical protein
MTLILLKNPESDKILIAVGDTFLDLFSGLSFYENVKEGD